MRLCCRPEGGSHTEKSLVSRSSKILERSSELSRCTCSAFPRSMRRGDLLNSRQVKNTQGSEGFVHL